MLSGSLAKCLPHARRYNQTFASTYYKVTAVVFSCHTCSPRCRSIGLPSEYSLCCATDCAGQGIPRKDRCLVNVLRYMPAEIAEFCHPRAQLGLPCTEADQNSWTYLVKLHLQDATGEIDAALFDKDADEFFQGFPAQDYSSTGMTDGLQSPACNALQQKMQSSLGLRSSQEGGVWLECCIKTYFTDRKRPLETCQFRILDTKLQ